MDEELRQSLDIDYMELLYEDDTVSIVELLVMHEGLNRNRCDIPHDVIVEALPSLANRPIWGIPNKSYLKDYSDDFIEHARNEEQEKNIMIFGVVPESGVKNAQFIEKDNKIYLKIQAILFKKYSPIAMHILEQRDNNCKISVEILAKGNTINDILYVNQFVFTCLTCLGADIKEGIENSQMEIVRFSLDEAIKESNEKYLNFAKEEISNKIIEPNVPTIATDSIDENSIVEIDNSKIINKEDDEVMAEENKKIEFCLNSRQIFGIFDNAISGIKYMNGDWECQKYWVEAYDENCVFLNDCEEGKTYKMPYILENNIATINFENKILVVGGGYLEVGANCDPENKPNEPMPMESHTDDEMMQMKASHDAMMEEMKNKYAELETKYAEIENKLKVSEDELVKNNAIIEKYARQDEEMKMMSMLQEFSHIFTEDEMKTMSEGIKESKFNDFESIVNSKIKEFALKSKKIEGEKETTIKNSYGVSISNFGMNEHYDYQNKNNTDISIAEKYGVKIK